MYRMIKMGMDNRFLILETAVIYLLVGENFFSVTPLVFKQFIAIEEALHGCLLLQCVKISH